MPTWSAGIALTLLGPLNLLRLHSAGLNEGPGVWETTLTDPML